jgi:replicative DNA helicase
MANLPKAKTKYDKAQRVLVGYLSNYPSMASDVFTLMREEHSEAFNVPTLRQVFKAMTSLNDRGVRICLDSLDLELTGKGISKQSLSQVLMECEEAAQYENCVHELGNTVADYVRALLDGHHFLLVQDRMKRAGSYQDILKTAEYAIALDAGKQDGFQRGVDELVDELIDVQTAIAEGRKQPGFHWGIPTLDDAMLIRPGKLYVIAAQKGAGKTKFLLSVLDHNLTRRDTPVPSLLFSLEMGDIEVIKYLASRRAEVDSSLIFTESLPAMLFNDIKINADPIRQAPLEIDSTPSLSVQEIISRIWHWKIKHGIKDDEGIVGVDFLQQVTLDRQGGQLTEATALKNVAYKLAEAAKRLRVSIIAVAQLNKQADGNRPEIGFIEGSGGLAQASQGVLLLDLLRLRENKYTRAEDGLDDLNIIIAKNRDGESMVTVPCRVDLSIGKFYDSAPAQRRLIK